MTTSMNVKTGTSKKGQAAPDPVKYERMTAKMAFQLAMIHTWPACMPGAVRHFLVPVQGDFPHTGPVHPAGSGLYPVTVFGQYAE